MFLDTQVVSHLPRFRLLLELHKSLRVDANGRWASRPIVDLTSWSTTASSILMATAGQILLKLDRVVDELNTPVRDTHDLLACVRAPVHSRRGNGDLLLTNFDFNALYTRISWSHLTHTFVWWRDWFHDLDGEVLSHLSTYERDFMQFIFAPTSTEAKDLLISELPILDVSQAPASLVLWLLNFIYHNSVFLNAGIALLGAMLWIQYGHEQRAAMGAVDAALF